MTTYSNLTFFALPFSGANLDLLQRCGVAFYAITITAGERNQLLAGARTIAQILANYTGDAATTASINAESLNFQKVYSTSSDGSTQDYYLGNGSMTAAQWGRMLGYLASPATGAVFCHADLQVDETWKISTHHSSTSALNALEGTTVPGMLVAITALGWVQYVAP